LLADNDAIVCPYEPSWSRSVHHLYVIRSEDRDEMMKHLKGAGIGTGIHYPIPLHMQKAYSRLHYNPTDFPVTRRIAAEIVSLPMFPHLTAEQQAQVIDEIFAFTSRNSYKELKSVEISALLPRQIA
jgi:dTDP-4-amino-4,6-dideoxygalactose transaminase